MARKSRKNLLNGYTGAVENITAANAKTVAANTAKHAAWGYARISNDSERAEDSIESQTAIIRNYAEEKADIDLRGVITDLGYSGTNFDRPGYAELLAGVICGEIQCVVVKDLSRLGRTYIEVGELLFDIFPANNVRFVSVNDDYDSFSDDAARKKLLILFKNLMNHLYSKDLGVKIRSSHALKQQKGELLGSLPPYGYLFTTEGGGKRLTIEPESAKIVKLIFDMREQGDSMFKIAEYLNHNNIPAPRNHYYALGVLRSEKDSKKALWQNGYIGNLLKNEVYIGSQIQGKHNRRGKVATVKPKSEWYIYENAHPAIIGREQFDTVQRLIAENGEKYKKHGNKLDENIFVGKIFCSRCGKSLKRQYSVSGKNRNIRYSYVCTACGSELRRSMNLESVPQLRYVKLETVVISALQVQISTCIEIDTLITDIVNSTAVKNKNHSLKVGIEKCRRAIQKADDMLASAYTHHLAGILSDNEFDAARLKFERDKQMAETSKERLVSELTGYDLDCQQQNAFLTNFRKHKGFTKLDKAIISALIHRIDVTPLTNEVSVVLNFMDELGKLNKLIAESGVLSNE